MESKEATILLEEQDDTTPVEHIDETPHDDSRNDRSNSSHKTRQKKREWTRAVLKHVGLLQLETTPGETPKYIVRRNLVLAITRCWVHAVPLAMLVVVSWLQLGGFYIGETLEGFHGDYSEAVKFLGLQVAAKVYELLVVASLATIVIDVTRSMLLQSSLPFGLLTAHLQFTELSFLWSPGFLSSRKGFRSWTRFTIVAALLATACVIALLTGPAAATLLIPVWRDDWAAGGTRYWLAGNADTLWPQRLTAQDVGPANCLSPGGDRVATQLISDAGCVWSGAASLNQNYRDTHQVAVVNVSLSDGLGIRTLQRRSSQIPEPTTIAPFAAVTNPSNNFAVFWAKALSAVSGFGSYAHYQRLGRGAYFEMESYVPLVRAKCYLHDNMTSPFDYWEYPYLPSKGHLNGTSYHIPKRPIINSTLPLTEWIVGNSSSNATIKNAEPDAYPSAFLNVQIPAGDSLTLWSGFLSCSVDARWVKSVNVGLGFNADVAGEYETHAQMPDAWLQAKPDTPFPWTDDVLPVEGSLPMDATWLATLTPEVAPSIDFSAAARFKGYTTIADMYRSMGVNNGFTAMRPIQPLLESVIATVVADGMSRVGYQLNGGGVTLSAFQNQVINRYNISFAPTSAWGSAVYRGEAATPLVPGFDVTNSTEIKLNAFIQGYSFRADGVAYWLSLALLYVHALLAIGHIAWRTWTGLSSDSWESALDLIALAAASDPSAMLKNTSGGVDKNKTMSVAVGARVVQKSLSTGLTTGREQVQIVFAADKRQLAFSPQSDRVQENVKYGAD